MDTEKDIIETSVTEPDVETPVTDESAKIERLTNMLNEIKTQLNEVQKQNHELKVQNETLILRSSAVDINDGDLFGIFDKYSFNRN